MVKRLIPFLALMLVHTAFSQNGTLPVYYCTQAGKQAQVSGIKSTNYMQGIVPSCTVTVYLTGTQTVATTTPQTPLTANSDGSLPPIYAAPGQGYDVVLSGGVFPNTYPSPATITNVLPGIYPAHYIDPTRTDTQTMAGSLNVNGAIATGTESVTTSFTNPYKDGMYFTMLYSLTGPLNGGGEHVGEGYVMASSDGINYIPLTSGPTWSPDYVHDAAPLEHNGQVYFAYTHEPGSTSTSFRISATGNLFDYATVTDVSMAAVSPIHVWSPKWFTDTDGSIYVYVGCADSGNKFHICITKALNNDLTSWSNAQIVYSDPNNVGAFDPFMIRIGSTYFLFFVQLYASGEVIQYATGNNPYGPFTLQTSGDWSGFGTAYPLDRQEGPSIVQLDNGCYRLFFDYSSQTPNNMAASDTCDLFDTMSTPVRLTPGLGLHQGQIIRTNQLATARVWSLSLQKKWSRPVSLGTVNVRLWNTAAPTGNQSQMTTFQFANDGGSTDSAVSLQSNSNYATQMGEGELSVFVNTGNGLMAKKALFDLNGLMAYDVLGIDGTSTYQSLTFNYSGTRKWTLGFQGSSDLYLWDFTRGASPFYVPANGIPTFPYGLKTTSIAGSNGNPISVPNAVAGTPYMAQTFLSGGGIYQTAAVSGCTTSATQYSTCDATITWPHAFADTNYNVVCSQAFAPTNGVPYLMGAMTFTTTTTTVRTMALTAAVASVNTITCVGVSNH